jgi:hypothetical protein
MIPHTPEAVDERWMRLALEQAKQAESELSDRRIH